MHPQTNHKAPRFALGEVIASPKAIAALQEAGQSPLALLHRHQVGDWGDLSAAEQAQNEVNLQQGLRLVSAYVLATQVKLWVVTEDDRSVTAVMVQKPPQAHLQTLLHGT